jgi:moderate conductance mechanosensitive channel
MIFAARALWISRLDRLHLLTPLRIVVMVLTAVIATVVVRLLVSRLVKRIPMMHDRVRADQRSRTLSTVLRSTLVAAIWLIVVITVLGEVGVNLGAFVATATIIGGALAFGAQTLVRDVIAGFFMIAEDQYGVGDVVDLGHAAGTVEQITLRATRVRDGEGRVWFVPNGQIVRVANLSQEYANAVLDVTFALTSPLGEATHSLQATLDKFEHPELLARPTVLGVHALADDRYELRISVRCSPGEQSAVRRALRAALVHAVQRGDLPAPPGGGPSVVVVNSNGNGSADTSSD